MVKEVLWFIFVFLVITTSCADDDHPSKEPIVSADDTSQYSEDPAMIETNVQENNNSATKDRIDVFATDPFGPDAPPIDNSDDELIADSTPDDENSEPIDYEEVYADALSDNHAVDSSLTSRAFPNANKPKKTVAPKAAPKIKAKKISKNMRYVKPMLLNVRSKPNLSSDVVRRLLGGAAVTILKYEPRGFVKIKAGQYIRVKHLSKTPTRRVTKKQVSDAWKKSNVKDNWKK